MAAFQQAFQITLGNEGTYSNNPADSGGMTYCGISRNNFPNCSCWSIIDSSPASSWKQNQELAQIVKDLYKKEFWDHFLGDEIASQEIANELFDTSVNMGMKVEGQFLQRALNSINIVGTDLTVDGVIGQGTIHYANLLNATQTKVVVRILNSLQCAKYLSITENNKTQRRFMVGWVANRVS